MSHTTTITKVVFSDVDALVQAVDQLKADGVRCELKQHCKPRAYYENQAGMNTNMPYVLYLQDSRYDVGFAPAEELNGYVIKADFFGGDIAKAIGAKPRMGENAEQANVGKLVQYYALAAAQKHWVMQGYTVDRVNQANGDVTLQVKGFN